MVTMTSAAPAPRRAYRDPDDRFLGGVASGVAAHLGLDPLPVRMGFLILAMMGGFGALVYAALWVLLPVRDAAASAPGLASATRQGRRTGRQGQRRELGIVVSTAVAALGFVVLLQIAGLGLSSRLFWPLLVAAAGLALLWWQSDEADRARWLTTSGGWQAWLRVLLGVALLVAAVSLALFQAGVSNVIGTALGAIMLGTGGVVLVVGPWLLRVQRDLRSERTERVRSQEREDVAAHLHDSVLQTLALIQRQARDPQAVTQLARTQERELRTWLFDAPLAQDATLRSALQLAAAEVEEAHRVPVEVVVVGDLAAGSAVSALVAAAREAMVNAAKHSGAPRVDVFAEVGGGQLEVFVRDRGSGFDVAAIAADRHGVRRSIVDRMVRQDGGAEIDSTPGDGTEVRLWLPVNRPSDASNRGG